MRGAAADRVAFVWLDTTFSFRIRVVACAHCGAPIEAAPGGGSRLRQAAEFHPDGLAGRAYWWVLLPVHAVIFELMARRVAEA